MHNVARLWDISRQAHTPQDILDALHPWGENNNLVLNNFLPKFKRSFWLSYELPLYLNWHWKRLFRFVRLKLF